MTRKADIDAKYLQAQADTLRGKWAARETMMIDCQLLYQMDTSDRKRGYEIIKNNIAHRAVTLSVALLTQGNLRVRAPTMPGQEEGSTGDKIERILRGLLRKADRNAMRRMTYPIRYTLASFEAIRGWWALLPLVTVDEGGNSHFDLRVLDPINVFPELGPDGPTFVVHDYYTTSAAAKEQWDKHELHADPSGLVRVVDYYDKTYNATSVDGQMVKSPLEHECGFIPLLTGPVGGSPIRSVWQDAYSYIEFMGLPVLFNVKELIRQQNKLFTLMMNYMERYVYGPVFVKSQDGRVIKLDLRTGKINFVKEDVKVENLPHQGPPPEMMALMNSFKEMISLGTYPDPMWGIGQPGESGFARSVLVNAARVTLGPGRFAKEFALEEAIHTWITWFSRKGVNPTEIHGFGRDNSAFVEKWDPGEIDPEIEVQVGIDMKMPQDMAQMANIIAILKQVGLPVSDYYMMDEFLGIEDVMGEFQRTIKERSMMNPKVLALRQADAWRKADRPDIAAIIESEFTQAPPGGPPGPGPNGQEPQPGGPMMREPMGPGGGGGEPPTLPSGMELPGPQLPTGALPLQMQGADPAMFERLRQAGLQYARR